MVAGGWAALLIVWRLFDTPEARTIEFGLQWGIFVALAAAVALSLAGARVRAAHRPEPPNPAAEEDEWERPARESRRPPPRPRPPAEPAAVTEVLRDPPGWEGEPPEAPGRAPRRASRRAPSRRPAARPPLLTAREGRTYVSGAPGRRLPYVRAVFSPSRSTTSGSSSVAMKIRPMPVAITGRDL